MAGGSSDRTSYPALAAPAPGWSSKAPGPRERTCAGPAPWRAPHTRPPWEALGLGAQGPSGGLAQQEAPPAAHVLQPVSPGALHQGFHLGAAPPPMPSVPEPSGLTFLAPKRQLSISRRSILHQSLNQRDQSRSAGLSCLPGPERPSAGGVPAAGQEPSGPPGVGLRTPSQRESRRGVGTLCPSVSGQRRRQAHGLGLAVQPQAAHRTLQASVSGPVKWGQKQPPHNLLWRLTVS